jgi:putative ABC transport system permease protein
VSLLDGLRHRLIVIWRGERYAREIERELQFHLELEALSRTSDALGPLDRELAARRLLGNTTYYKEEVRAMTLLTWLDRLRQDAAYAWRGLKRSPGFTTAVVLTLGLGIGVNAAMFGLLDQLFVRPPAGVSAPKQIRRLYVDLSRPNEPGGRLAFDSFNYPYYRAVVGAEDSTVRIAAFTQPDSTAIVESDASIPVRRSLVTANYFGLLGVRPERGRFFAADEDHIEHPTPVVVLSDAFWRSTFAANGAIIGRTIRIDSHPCTVIGIAERGFSGIDLDAVDVWIPANNYGGSSGDKEPWFETFQSSFRLLTRVSTAAADERITTVATSAVRSVHLRGWAYDSTATVRSGPIVRALGPAKGAQELSISTRLAGVALMVLFIAYSNVANLLLVRATRRRREIAVRRALGVSTPRLYGQLLTESVLLSALGGITAMLFALWAGTALRHLLLPNVHWASAAITLRTLTFVGVLSLVAGIAAGLAPAANAMRPDLVDSLKAGGREGFYQRSKLRSALLIIQAGLSVVLLVGAGLFVRSLSNVRGLDLGYDVGHVLVVRPTFTGAAPPAAQIAAALPQIAERLRTVPGVQALAYASSSPMSGFTFSPVFLPDRDSLPMLGNERMPSMIGVSPDYFRASGIRLISGRVLSAADRPDRPSGVVVSQTMARVYWPGQNPLGKCIILGDRSKPCSIVVGVVADVHRMAVIEQPTMQYYVPVPVAGFGAARELIIRTSEREMPTVSRIATEEFKRLFPQMSVPRIRSMASMLEPQFRPWRLGATLFTAFGTLAVIVAAIGVYSVVAYAVSQRTHEMGIRIALGARMRDIVRLVLGESSRVVIVGVALGIVTAVGLSRLVASLLYGVSPRDPVVIGGAACILLAIGLVASIIPGWRAGRVDPATALRAD